MNNISMKVVGLAALLILFVATPSYALLAPGGNNQRSFCAVGGGLQTEDEEDIRVYQNTSRATCLGLGGCYSGRNLFGTLFTQCAGGPRIFQFML